MPVCQICQKELGCINSNHLKKHDITIEEYYERFPEFKPSRKVTSAKSVANKTKQPKKTLSTNSISLLAKLYELNDTIQIPKRFHRIETVQGLDKMILQCRQVKEIDLDTETTGLEMFLDKITDYSITIHDAEGNREYNYHIPLFHITKESQGLTNEEIMEHIIGEIKNNHDTYVKDPIFIPEQLGRNYVVSKLKPLLEDPEIDKNLYNDYFDEIMLWADQEISLAGVAWDGLIAAYDLNENESSHKLKDIYHRYLYDKESDPEIKALGVETFEEQFGKLRFFRIPMNVATAYATKDSYMTGRLKDFQKPYIDSIPGLANVFYNVDSRTLPVLVNMRKRGIYIDIPYAKETGVVLSAQREIVKEQIIATIGDINLNSPKQIAKVLFDDLGLPDLQKGSTKAAVLQELADSGFEIAEQLLDYKKAEKLISTYLDNAENMISPVTKRVHCRFNNNGTVTGRLSSSGPNLQNIPSKNHEIRKMFRAQVSENCLLSCDFS